MNPEFQKAFNAKINKMREQQIMNQAINDPVDAFMRALLEERSAIQGGLTGGLSGGIPQQALNQPSPFMGARVRPKPNLWQQFGFEELRAIAIRLKIISEGDPHYYGEEWLRAAVIAYHARPEKSSC